MFTWKRYACEVYSQPAVQDIAALQLSCAVGLPGAEAMDAGLCLRTLDDWAEKVRYQTCKHFPQFRRRPGDYHHSEAYFRVLALATTLQRDCGVRYNPAKIPEDAVFEPADSFLYGIIQKDGGTCATIPVVYAAVGRRLGYPIKLARSKGAAGTHLFARWDSPWGERFNIEATGTGLWCPPDDHYRTGRFQITPEIEEQGCFIRSMTQREELAGFCAERFHCWKRVGRWRRAVEALAWASALARDNAFLENTLKITMNDWLRDLKSKQPPGCPEIYINSPQHRFPKSLPPKYEQNIFGLEATENLLLSQEHERNWWRPMREGKALASAPTRATAVFDSKGYCTIRFRFSGKP
jgi:hypothetical protein